MLTRARLNRARLSFLWRPRRAAATSLLALLLLRFFHSSLGFVISSVDRVRLGHELPVLGVAVVAIAFPVKHFGVQIDPDNALYVRLLWGGRCCLWLGGQRRRW